MNILYVWDADYPWDVRVEKICATLVENGFDVHVAARNLKRLPEFELVDGLRVHRMKPRGGERMNYFSSFPAFFSPLWRRFLDRTIQTNEIDLLIVRDLPLAITGIWAGHRHGIPVVFDMAEDYVAMVRDIWRARKFSGLNLVVRNPHLARLVERYSLKRADHVIVVVEESRRRILRQGVPPTRVSIVSNTPPLRVFNRDSPPADSTLEAISRHYSAIYTGGIQMGRGIQVVLDAIPEIVRTIPDFLFVVAGDGYAVARIKAMVEQRRLEDHVMWVGWVDRQAMFDLLRACKVGIIPHFATDHVNTTVPNKLFDYMGVGLPVIASDAIPLKRILDEEGCGLTFKSGDASDLASTVNRLHSSANEFGTRGKAAVYAKYNWAEDTKRLIAAVQSLST